MHNIKFIFFILLTGLAALPAQEALLSPTEQYYDFLALDGNAERPYLNYRTLSDSKWTVAGLGTTRPLGYDLQFRIYGPELFSSYNTAAPYGQNDGALWQGKGLNSSITGGARLEGFGFELTLKPVAVFSQNQGFDTIQPAYSGAAYAGKADTYGYFGIANIDAPQRFGDDPLFDFSWGDSEIRYTWKTLTAGFGTQSIWLGPAKINAIMHSNNAAPYPKADMGLRRTPVTIFGRYAGDVEARLWAGYLSESDYFDTDDADDHNLFSGLAVAYAPSVLPGLTLFANRSYLSKWKIDNAKSLLSLMAIDIAGGGAQDVWDQRASVGFDCLVPMGGIEVYGEAGINDYGPSLDGYIRYPFHSMVYTGGFRKSVPVPFLDHARGEFLFEWSNLEMSQDFQFQWPSTFYAHHQITQGYTNEGQWLGAGNGTGGNSQYIGFKIFHPKGSARFFVHRMNPDNDYIYQYSVMDTNLERMEDFKAVLAFGFDAEYAYTDELTVKAGITCVMEHNPLYNSIDWGLTEQRRQLRLETGLYWKL